MASKIITFIALFLAILFLVSSQSAAARELSDQTSYDDPPNMSYGPVVEPPSCGYSCNSSKKKLNTKPNSKPHN